MIVFVHIDILLRFLINFFSKYCSNYSIPSPGGFVTVTLNSGISIYLVDILNTLFDQIQHEDNMLRLADSYYHFIVNKVHGLKTITLMDSSYILSNLKPINIFESNNLPTFTFKPQNINIYFPIINMFNICLQNIYIIIPAIIIILKPIFVIFSNKLDILLKKLLNLSKIS